MKRMLLTALLMMPVAALAQLTPQPLVGVSAPVNTNPGPQTDPHVSGNLVAYTDESAGSQIRYHYINSGVDQGIPTASGTQDYLSDVSGSLIVFTRDASTQRSIYAFDTNAGTATELAPQAGAIRDDAAIGGNTVAWVDIGITGNSANGEIFVYDLTSAASTRITNNTLGDRDPSVSPDGDAVSWTQCPSADCNIHVALKSATGWTDTALTSGTLRRETRSTTDGTLVAYQSQRSDTGEIDIAYQPVTGGTETFIPIAGDEANPSASGELIAFEHRDPAIGSNADILLFDTRTTTLYQLTNSPDDERLTDIDYDPVSGLVRVVYVRDENTDWNVYVSTFTLQAPPPPPPVCTPDDDDDEEEGCGVNVCANPGNRPVLATLTVTRTTGAPNSNSVGFNTTAHEVTLCVDNGMPTLQPATAGWVRVNGHTEIGPGRFHKNVSSISERAHVYASNTLSATIAGQKGTSYTVTVYGPKPPNCEDDGDGDDLGQSHDELLSASVFDVRGVGDEDVRRIDGRKLNLSGGDAAIVLNDGPLSPISGGCSSTGAATGALALLALGFLLARRPATVRARRR